MTIPYVSGTVSVTAGNAVVTGNGTGWQTGLVIGGLFGLDSANGNPVPILSIDSDTQLTLAKPWRGTTAANQAYWIVRETTYAQQMTANAQALATYIQRLDNAALAALATLAPAADKMAYFSGAGTAALSDIKAKGRDILAATTTLALLSKLGPVSGGRAAPAPSGADVGLADGDFDQMAIPGEFSINGNRSNGYLGAASASYGGILRVGLRNNGQLFHELHVPSVDRALVYGRIFANGTWRAWKLVRTGIVGIVSRTGTVIDGDIIERGSNANGEYVRFADGTQICWTFSLTANPTVDSVVTWTLPAAVSGTNVNLASINYGDLAAADRGAIIYSWTSNRFVLFKASAWVDTSVTVFAVNIGRWF
ncbi:phage tail protein [Ensifer sp. NM-2]|uniref:phage tail protein n=1 Tax=Ensifer sp. NM-2 TaxID=2109730 RepID=UPI001FE0AC26|nr:phage tail protein [Ensifer sp. NM-2]